MDSMTGGSGPLTQYFNIPPAPDVGNSMSNVPGVGGVAPQGGWADPFTSFSANDDNLELVERTMRLLRAIGSVNILVAGQTGVGKSTLINSVFGNAVARTASGRPVTQKAEWYSSATLPLNILDTRGLEAKEYYHSLREMRHEIESARAETDAGNQMHMAWVCISAPSSRVQDCDVDLVRVLNKYDIPAIIILTKYDDDPDFIDDVRTVMDERFAKYAAIVPLRALAKSSRPSFGLDKLVHETFEALPGAHRAAFAASQRVNRDINRTASDDYITAATSAAAASAVIPIPFADVATLAPIQAGMLLGISNAFGVTLERQQILQLLSTVLGFLAVSMAGRWIVGNALKFIPGPGSILGSALNAGLAGTLTRSLGKTYSRFLYSFLEQHGRVPSADEIFKSFPEFFRSSRDD